MAFAVLKFTPNSLAASLIVADLDSILFNN
jgi:hypothetical protein